MSGTAGIESISKYYYLKLDSGMSVCVDPPPACDNPGRYIAEGKNED